MAKTRKNVKPKGPKSTKILPGNGRPKEPKRPKVLLDPPPPNPEPCDMCLVCQQSLTRDGIPVCQQGEVVLANDYPTTGGPWMIAFNANGSGWTWVNAS